MSSEITTDVRVTLILKEFILATNGCDKVYVKKRSDFSASLPNLLKLRPQDYKPIRNRSYYIRLVLPYIDGVDIRNRNFLDEHGQHVIFQKLNRNFKLSFHSFMLAWVRSGKKQSDGIVDFCETYFIKCDDMNFDMLKKSWDRSREKKIWKMSLSICPLIY